MTNQEASTLNEYLIILGSMAIGLLIIYTLGALQLMVVANLTLNKAITQGILPFIVSGLIKIGIGSGLAYYVRKRLIAAQLLSKTSNVKT